MCIRIIVLYKLYNDRAEILFTIFYNNILDDIYTEGNFYKFDPLKMSVKKKLYSNLKTAA